MSATDGAGHRGGSVTELDAIVAELGPDEVRALVAPRPPAGHVKIVACPVDEVEDRMTSGAKPAGLEGRQHLYHSAAANGALPSGRELVPRLLPRSGAMASTVRKRRRSSAMVRLPEKMGRLRFQRELWQATVWFEPQLQTQQDASITPIEVGKLLAGVGTLLPAEGVQWQMPAFSGVAPVLQFEMLPGGGGVQRVTPDFLVGTSASGWVIQLSSRQLVVRHQQIAVGPTHSVPEAAFPSDTKFTEVVQNALALLPESLIAHARRTSWLLNYAMFTGDEYPASWVTTLTGRGRPLKYPPPDGTSLVLSHQEQAFETIERRRYVWNMMTRVANWFGEDGLIRQNGAVARSVEVKTASPEPDGPVANYPGVESMPLLDRSDAQNFFSATGPTGLRRVIERLKSELPKEVTVDE